MEAKKNLKYDVQGYSNLFFHIGLVVSFSLVMGAFNWEFKSVEEVVSINHRNEVEDVVIPITEIPEPQPPKPKVMAREFIEVSEPEIQIQDFEIVIDQDEIFDFIPDPDVEIEAQEEEAEEIYMIVEEMPEPIGGYSAFYAYLGQNLKFPPTARRLGIEGKVFVMFVVNQEGDITHPVIVKGIGGGCDEEAIRVIEHAPKWKPGKQRGVPVKVQVVLPIHFILRG